MLRFRYLQALVVLALLFNSASNPVLGSPVMENCVEPPPCLVSWWPGDGNADDIYGTSSGTLQNGATFAAGKVGQAFSFDGVNAFVNVPNSAPIANIRSAITVDMWVNPLPQPFDGNVFSRRDPFVSESFSIGIANNGSLCVTIRTTTTPYVPEVRSYASVFVSRPGVITFGQFHHIAVTADTATTGLVKAYVDGQEISLPYTYGPATLSGLFWSVSNLFIGQRQSSNTWEGAAGGRHYRGLIDEVEVYNRVLSANEIQAIFSAGSAGKCKPFSISGRVTNASNNPISGVTISDTAGHTSTTDSNGNYTLSGLAAGVYTITPSKSGYIFSPLSRTITVPPDPTGQDFTGTSNSGYALLFDGLNDYVKLPDWNLNNLTLEARFRLADLQNYKGIINRENDVQLGVGGSKLHYVLELGSGNWVNLDSQQSLRDSVWYHVAVTYDGATMKMFINGELDNQRSASGSIFRDVCTIYWVIGATYGGPCHNYYEWFWSGTLDEIRVWDYARSQSEIQSTMDTLLTGNEAGLIGYWQFNEGEGQIAYDSSGHGRNGVLGSTANPDDNDPTWTIGGFYVTTTGPSSGATGVPTTTTEITATFSTSVSVPSLNRMTVLFSDGVSNITGTIEYDAAGKMMTFHPAYLVEGTTYTMTLTSGIVAASDPNTHLAQYQWRFTTVGSKRDKLIAALRDLKSAINGKILQDADTIGFDFGLARELHKLKTWIDFLSIPANVVLMWTGKDAPHLFDNLDTFKDIVGKVGLAMKVDGVIDDTPSMEARFGAMVRSADEAYGGNPWLGIPFDLLGYQQYVKLAVMGTDSPMNSIPLMNGPVGTNPTIIQRGTALDVRSDVTQKFEAIINELPNPLPSTLDTDQLIAELKALTRSIRRSQWTEQDVTYNAYFPGGLRPQTLSLGVVAQDSKMSNALIHSAADNVEEKATVAAMKTAVGGVKLALLVASASASAVAETIYLPIDLAMLPSDLADIADQLTGIDPQTMLDEHAYRMVLHYGQETSTVWRLANDVVSTVNYRVAHSTSALTKANTLSGAGISVAGLRMPDVVMGVTRTIGMQTGVLTVTNTGASPLRLTLNGQIIGPTDSFGNSPVVGVFDSHSFVDIPVGVTVPLTFTYSALRSLSTEPTGYEAQAFVNVLDMSTSAFTTYGPWRAHFFAGTTDQLTTLNQQTVTVPISGTLATGQMHEQLITLLPTTHRVRFVLSQSPSSDLDLHIYDTMGHHIGVNYTSMITEVQIAGSTYSGNEAQTEWIEVEPVTGTQQLRIQVVGLDAGDATHYAVAAIQAPSLPAMIDTFPEYIRTRTSTLATTVSFTAREVGGQSGVTGVQVSPSNLDDGQGHIIPSANITFAVPITTVAAGGEVPITGTISLPANPVESTYTGSILLTGRDAISGTPVTATIGLDLIYARLRLYLPIVLHQY